MSIPRSDLLHRPLIIYAVFGTCISWRIGPVFSTCWGTKFSDVLVPVELARSFLRLCRWPYVNTRSFCHGSIQICFWGPYQLGPACVPSITESVESYFSACQRTNVYFLQRLRPLPRFSVWKHHTRDTRIPFFMAVTQFCFIICLTHQHPGSFKVKLMCIHPSRSLYFHLVRTSEGPKMSLRATCGILEQDANSKRMLASGNVYGYQRRSKVTTGGSKQHSSVEEKV